ncbi:peptidase S8/S53 domain-containing protein [Bisporella sp. PMI_857]|nr:peptidase S8/S53 domain-containing protein [Bisporella sp. PMI_857]
MHFSALALAALLSPALGSPISQTGEAAAALVPGVNIANAQIAGTDKAIKDSYIVVYKASASDADIAGHEANVAQKLKKAPNNKFNVGSFRGYHLETDPVGLAQVANNPLVDYVEIDQVVSVNPIFGTEANFTASIEGDVGAAALVTRSGSVERWGLGRISHRLRSYVNYIYDSSGCSGTHIYIIDTGIKASHQEFNGRAYHGANYVSGSPNTDENGHGTHCAGIAAGNNVGVCPYATVVGVKVLDADGFGSLSNVISGVQWAVHDAQINNWWKKSVISMSLSGGKSDAINAAVESAVNQGISVVVAAGNANADASAYSPASTGKAITVGATDFNDNRASFSNYGAVLDLFAPGVNIKSSWIGNADSYSTQSGTSMAAPHVAGLVAYIIAKENPQPDQIRNRIVELATTNKVIDPMGSANRIANNGNGVN